MQKHLTTALLGTAIALASSLAMAKAPVAYNAVVEAPSNKQEAEIAQLFDRWNKALASGNPDNVAHMYAKNAVLLPTVSNWARTDYASIRDYFVKFLSYKPQGFINKREIRLLDDNNAMDTGIYTFALHEKGQRKLVQARYTYVYTKENDQWKILNHHSSAMPEALKPEQINKAITVAFIDEEEHTSVH
ncbi:MAG: SgcJ/EcaC family oxidoreductase [Paraperlucidibaca sp.]